MMDIFEELVRLEAECREAHDYYFDNRDAFPAKTEAKAYRQWQRAVKAHHNKLEEIKKLMVKAYAQQTERSLLVPGDFGKLRTQIRHAISAAYVRGIRFGSKPSVIQAAKLRAERAENRVEKTLDNMEAIACGKQQALAVIEKTRLQKLEKGHTRKMRKTLGKLDKPLKTVLSFAGEDVVELTGTKTGRTQSVDPNTSNTPKRSK